MAKKQCLLIVPLVMLLWLMPRGAWAYGKDIHFSLTYVLCRLAGIEVNDSLWIAAADQSMDNNKSTTAFPGFLGTANQRLNPLEQKIYATNGKNWHDFSDAGADENANPPLPVVMIRYKNGGFDARAAILDRERTLWSYVPHGLLPPGDDKARIKADIAFGQFLHFEQDYYSHRQLTKDAEDDAAYLPYGPQWGHAIDVHMPDEVARRIPLAKKMAKACYIRICQYAHSDFGKSPNQSLDLAPLIDALASSYKVVVTHYGKGGPPPTTDYPIPDTSEVVNDKLLPCLKTSFSSSWPGPDKLPVYMEPSCDLTLPYDNPKIPLQDVTRRFQAATSDLTSVP